MSQSISIETIAIDPRLQVRTALDQNAVADYADRYREGTAMPPVVVFRDGDGHHWLADGFHRVTAAKDAGLTEIAADLREGEFRDALLYAASANATHGLRRTNADKRRAIEMALSDPEWQEKSDREIARHCGVSHEFARITRASLSTNDSDGPRKAVYRNKHGGISTMNVANIGKGRRKASEPSPVVETPPESPPAPVVDSDLWPDWINRAPTPDMAGFLPTAESLRTMSPEQAAQAIVEATFGESADPRIPIIPNVTTGGDFRQAYWRAMIARAKERLGE